MGNEPQPVPAEELVGKNELDEDDEMVLSADDLTRGTEELPEEEIEAAEGQPAAHDHGPLDDAGLLEHLRSSHRLDVPAHVSRSTAEGLHDRLHDATDATGRPPDNENAEGV